jgi:excisionase family DNA binding protein
VTHLFIVDVDARLAAHLAVAITTYTDRARRSYRAVPPELHQFAQALTTQAMAGQAGPILDHPVVQAHAEHVDPQLLTLTEVARVLRISARTVRRRITSGELPAAHCGHLSRIRVADLDDYLNNLR